MTRLKGQGSTCQSGLDDAKAAVERLMSLGRQYERQVQDTRRLLETARLDLSRSGASLSRAVRECVCVCHASNPEYGRLFLWGAGSC